MPLRRLALYAVVSALLTACTNQTAAPPTADINFVRGCWISRGSATGYTETIRLLPSRTGAAKLEGELLHYNTQSDANTPPFRLPISVDLDGSHASFSREVFAVGKVRGVSGPAVGWVRQSWLSVKKPGHWLVMEGDGDHLKVLEINLGDGSSATVTNFDGARDGCD